MKKIIASVGILVALVVAHTAKAFDGFSVSNWFNAILLRLDAVVEADAETTDVDDGKPIRLQPPNPIKGIYMTVNTMSRDYGSELIDSLVANGGNAVVIDIEHGGGLLAFRPKNEFLKTLNPGSDTLDNLSDIIASLHEKGIYTIARQVVFNDSYMGSRQPDWRIKNKWGGWQEVQWLDPSAAGAQNYNLYVMKEVADLGFDEIQFDYIRFPATNHRNLDYDYDEEAFSRADVIVDFLQKARRVADESGVRLGVDVFGAIVWGDVDWKIVGQDPARMAAYVDTIYPMTYPSHVSPGYYGFKNPYGAPYGFIHDSIARFNEKAAGNADIRTWVQGFPLKIPHFGSWFVDEQVNASFDAGATGFIVWSPKNVYTLSWPAFAIDPKPAEPEKPASAEEE